MAQRTVRILACPNAYKGSMTAERAAQAISEGAERASDAQIRFEVLAAPLADGGDGTLETLVKATNGRLFQATVTDPLGRPVQAAWGRLGGAQSDTAVIEMAEASGLRLLRSEERDPLRASTYGTGELMRIAVEAGCKRLLIGIGGSATNDGGAGMAQALGVHFLDAEGRELPPGGAALARLAQIDATRFAIPKEVEVVVACDVNNPLCGAEGASAIYGPQKGATPERIRELDAALARYANVLEAQLGVAVADVPGAGAAGGLGAGLLAFGRAKMQPGIELTLDAIGFDEKIRTCRLAITGEGRLDGQTTRGKAIGGAAQRAKAAGVPLIALAGALAEGAEDALNAAGLTAAFSIIDQPMTAETAIENGYSLLSAATTRVLRLARVCFDDLALPAFAA